MLEAWDIALALTHDQAVHLPRRDRGYTVPRWPPAMQTSLSIAGDIVTFDLRLTADSYPVRDRSK